MPTSLLRRLIQNLRRKCKRSQWIMVDETFITLGFHSNTMYVPVLNHGEVIILLSLELSRCCNCCKIPARDSMWNHFERRSTITSRKHTTTARLVCRSIRLDIPSGRQLELELLHKWPL